MKGSVMDVPHDFADWFNAHTHAHMAHTHTHTVHSQQFLRLPRRPPSSSSRDFHLRVRDPFLSLLLFLLSLSSLKSGLIKRQADISAGVQAKHKRGPSFHISTLSNWRPTGEAMWNIQHCWCYNSVSVWLRAELLPFVMLRNKTIIHPPCPPRHGTE